MISNVDIHNFFYSFDDFSLKGIGYQNLKGYLSATGPISGEITKAGGIVPGSLNGTVSINLKMVR